MPCSCGSGQQGELWEPVFADGTVGTATTKAAAQAAVAVKGGYIRQKS